jgi:hypothetical protein
MVAEACKPIGSEINMHPFCPQLTDQNTGPLFTTCSFCLGTEELLLPPVRFFLTEKMNLFLLPIILLVFTQVIKKQDVLA